MVRLLVLGSVLVICTLVFGRGGLRRLSEARFQRPYLPVVALAVQMLAIYSVLPLPVAVLLSGAQLGLFCLYNLRQWPVTIIAVGLMLNQAVMLANGGAMPVTEEHAAAYAAIIGHEPVLGKELPQSKDVVLPHDQIRLRFLSDTIVLPNTTVVYSLGDIFILTGGLLWIILTMAGLDLIQRRSHRWEASRSPASTS